MKNLAIRIIVFISCLFLIEQAYAQHKVTGRILNESADAPLEIANVVLSTADSVYVAGATTNTQGRFELKNIAAGDYQLTTSYLGYATRTISLSGLSNSIDLGDIYMSEESNLLEAVTVTASAVTNKTDRMIVFVTDRQKAVSSNGINILAAMQLPRLIVNPLTNEVSLPGDGSVQFCINGMKVNNSDVKAIQPDEIIRVEYLDNPGLRYGSVDAVINYILKREVIGGSVSLDLTNAVTTSFGDDLVAAKLNYKKSEFGFGYSNHYRNPDELWTDQEQTFIFSDGMVLKRYDKGLPGDNSENYHHFSFNYSLLHGDKSYFNATVRYSMQDDERMSHYNQTNSLYPGRQSGVRQGADTYQKLPSLDLYYSRNLKNKQTLIFNVVGTYIDSKLNQQYKEVKDEETITNIISDVKGEKYSIIGEGIYEKVFVNSNRFTAGLKHTRSHVKNEYLGTVNSLTKMDQAETYLYGEYSGRRDKFSYTGGVGVLRMSIKQAGEKEYDYFVFRPKLTLQYDFTPSMFVRLRGEAFEERPSLSNLSDVEQYIDTLQIKRGNPGLKKNLIYISSLMFNWRKDIYQLNFNTSYLNAPDPIMASLHRENDKFIHTYENHKSWQKLNSEVSLNVGPVKDFLTLSLAGGVNHFISKGNTYDYTHTNFYYRAQVMATYKRVSAIFQANSAYNHFSGETLKEGENIHLFMLSYNGGKYTVGAGIMYPFSSQYKRKEENKNQYAPSLVTMYANDFSRMVLLKFAWNFNYGRKAKYVNKRIHNSDTDTGIMKTN